MWKVWVMCEQRGKCVHLFGSSVPQLITHPAAVPPGSPFTPSLPFDSRFPSVTCQPAHCLIGR